MPPQKASKSAPKADASEKAKSADRDWMTTGELATKIGWREHALRDALRGKDLAGVRPAPAAPCRPGPHRVEKR